MRSRIPEGSSPDGVLDPVGLAVVDSSGEKLGWETPACGGVGHGRRPEMHRSACRTSPGYSATSAPVGAEVAVHGAAASANGGALRTIGPRNALFLSAVSDPRSGDNALVGQDGAAQLVLHNLSGEVARQCRQERELPRDLEAAEMLCTVAGEVDLCADG